MKNITFVSLVCWSFAGSFGFNTDILAIDPVNQIVVLGVLIFFGKGVLSNQKWKILNTIRNLEELKGAIQRLEKARVSFQKIEREADQFRVNRYSEIEREKLNLIKSTYKTLEELENYKNETICFDHQRAVYT